MPPIANSQFPFLGLLFRIPLPAKSTNQKFAYSYNEITLPLIHIVVTMLPLRINAGKAAPPCGLFLSRSSDLLVFLLTWSDNVLPH